MLSVIIISYKRKDDLIECVNSLKHNIKVKFEIIIVHNDMEQIQFEDKSIIEVIPEYNLGVAGGRNYGVNFSKYNYLFFIDDDATLVTEVSLDVVKKLNYITPVLAVKSIDYYTGFLRPKENVKINNKGFCNKYVGVGHFILKEVFLLKKGYDIISLYGMEEFNFQYKLLNDNQKIKFSNTIVKHKKSLEGRDLDYEEKITIAETKIKLIANYVPIELVLVHYIFWSLYVFKSSKKFLKLNIIYQVLKNRTNNKRNRLHFYKTAFETSTNIFY